MVENYNAARTLARREGLGYYSVVCSLSLVRI